MIEGKTGTDHQRCLRTLGIVGDALSDRTEIKTNTVPRETYRRAKVPVTRDACLDEESSKATIGTAVKGQEIKTDIEMIDKEFEIWNKQKMFPLLSNGLVVNDSYYRQ